jgi:uncharacterized delta-60 repeat protein
MKNKITILFVFGLTSCFAQGGILDASFGTNGYTTVNVTPLDDNLTAIAVQNDDKTLVLGRSYLGDNNFDFSLCRLNTDGSLDTSYGTDGINTISDVNRGYPLVLKLQPDGKAIAAGAMNAESLAILRYNEDGSLDTTFGTGGRVYFNLSPSSLELVQDLMVLDDGKIMLLAAILIDSRSSVGLIKLNHDGTLDTTFNLIGYRIKTAPVNKSYGITKMIVQPDGKFVASGTLNTRNVTYNYSDAFITRINADGTDDITFATNSNFNLNIYLQDYISNITLLNDGSIVALGTAIDNSNLEAGPSGGVFLLKLNADGSPSTTFGNNGIVLNDLINTTDSLDELTSSLLVGPDNKFYLGGYYRTTYSYSSFKGYVACLDNNGTIDTNFGTNGIAYFNNYINSLSDIKFDSNNNIIVAGTYNYSDNKFRIGRLTPNSILGAGITLKDYIAVYPNPVSNVLYTTIAGNFAIYDTTGRVVSSGYTGFNNSINTEQLSTGSFFIKINSGNAVYGAKFIKI